MRGELNVFIVELRFSDRKLGIFDVAIFETKFGILQPIAPTS